ncbi:ABC transporter permease [Rhodococcus sp. SMB37]|uniref:ABC transporter permease n=1 Tax=unclassified Rhodococcus (in: high G+C Gram-positive bacteria) TaxID=192944 RepID=UPI0010CEDF46|nr:ABC transporter permease [Rhodococcus sp. SMB37]TCN53610.1 peptide/nickel transport system permease protein [Rhodococcus sp. SMB37]
MSISEPIPAGAIPPPPVAVKEPRGKRFRGGRKWRALRTNRAAMVSLAFLVLLVLVAVFGSLLMTHDPNAQALGDRLQGPTGEHWLGTDGYGRDVYSRLIDATQVVVLAIVQAMALAAVVGIPLGLLAGLVGGPVDAVLSRIAEALLALPPLILALAVVGVLGPGLTNAMIAVGMLLAPRLFRISRSEAQAVSGESYIEACRSVGCSNFRLLWRHVLPNASSALMIQVTFGAGIIIIVEASLSFLGLGVESPQASWGSMLQDAFQNVSVSPSFMIVPTMAIVLTVLALSTFGDGMRDAFEGRGANG